MTLLDRAHFNHMTGGDRALQVEILALFRVQAETWSGVAALPWREAAHTLKGSARGIGLFALADACEVAEQASDGELEAALAGVRMALIAALAELDHFAADAA